MFRPKRVLKVGALGLQKDKEWFISTIHSLGLLHIDDLSDKIKSGDVYKRLFSDTPLPDVERVGNLLLRVNFLREVFHERLGRVDSVKSGSFSTLKNVVDDSEESLSHFEKDVSAIAHELVRVDEALTSKRDELSLLDRFGLSEFSLSSNSSVRLLFGRVLKSDFDKFKFSSDFKKRVVVAVGDFSKLVYSVAFCFASHDESLVAGVLRQLNVERERVHLSSCSKKELESQISELSILKERLLKSLNKFYELHSSTLSYLHGVLCSAKERAEVASLFGKTNKTFYVEAFIVAEKLDVLRDSLRERHIVLSSVVPDDAPVILHDVPYVSSFRLVTTMFGYPVYSGIDPTFFVSIFFPLFFGFMLSDAAYGAFVLLASLGFFLARNKNPVFKDISVISLACGLSTVLFGLLFGSFLGGLVKLPILWVDPFKDAMVILSVAIGLGVLHANIGILLSAIGNISRKEWKKFLLENCSLWVLQVGAFFMFKNYFVGLILLCTGLLLFLVKSSLFGIMEISGFVGLILSYARILALCLATGGIALAVNIMAEQFHKFGVIGVIMGVIVLLLGHGFNFLINIIGSTIHSTRLHFVEFFSLFFAEGGKKFDAFGFKRERS